MSSQQPSLDGLPKLGRIDTAQELHQLKSFLGSKPEFEEQLNQSSSLPRGGHLLAASRDLQPHPSSFDTANHPFDPLLIRFLKLVGAQPIEGTQYSFEIQPGAYSAFPESCPQNEAEVLSYFYDKLRCDLEDYTILTVKTASILHEGGLIDIHDSIRAQINSLISSSDESTREMLHDIVNVLTAKVELEDGHKSPDMQYRMAASARSGIVFETAWSETLSHLSSKAKGYILGGIQLVIGFKISYPSPDNLGLHVWRLRAPEQGDETSDGVLKEVEDQIVEGDIKRIPA